MKIVVIYDNLLTYPVQMLTLRCCWKGMEIQEIAWMWLDIKSYWLIFILKKELKISLTSDQSYCERHNGFTDDHT